MNLKKEFADFPAEDELMRTIMHTSLAWENEILMPDIERWLGNFKGEVYRKQYERLFALWLLSHFTFYNQREVAHLCRVVYRDLLHRILKSSSAVSLSPTALVDDFFHKAIIIPSERLSGSGGFISYFFRTENELPIGLFNFSIANVGSLTENIIIIDDVTLSLGRDGQLYKFFRINTRRYPRKKFYLLTLIASTASIEYLTKHFGVEVITAIRLDARDKCFDPQSDVFSSFPRLARLCMDFAFHYGRRIGIVEPLGYRNGQYTFGFFYNTPDNTLPIFWGQVNGWIPIIKRYHKVYGVTKEFCGNEQFL